MTSKNADRKQKIVDTAIDVFREQGSGPTAVSAIAARLGESKESLCAEFPSVPDMTLEIIAASLEKQGAEVFHAALAAEDIEQALRILGTHYLRFIMSPGPMAMVKLLAADAGCTQLAETFYAKGPGRFLAELQRFLQHYVDRGSVQPCNTGVMAMHLKALYEAELGTRRSLGLLRNLDGIDVTGVVDRAVRIFLRGYATETYRW